MEAKTYRNLRELEEAAGRQDAVVAASERRAAQGSVKDSSGSAAGPNSPRKDGGKDKDNRSSKMSRDQGQQRVCQGPPAAAPTAQGPPPTPPYQRYGPPRVPFTGENAQMLPTRGAPVGGAANTNATTGDIPRVPRDINAVDCYNCGELGHYASDCPKKAKKNWVNQQPHPQRVAGRYSWFILTSKFTVGILRWKICDRPSCWPIKICMGLSPKIRPR